MTKMLFGILLILGCGANASSTMVSYTLFAGGRQGTDDLSGIPTSGYSNSTTTNYEGGLYVNLQFLDHLGIRSGVEYVQRSFAITQNGSTGIGGYQMSTAEIPIYAFVPFTPWFSLFGGVDVGFKLSSGTTASGGWTWGSTAWNDNSSIVAPRVGLDFTILNHIFVAGYYEFNTTLSTQGTGSNAWVIRGTSIGAQLGYTF